MCRAHHALGFDKLAALRGAIQDGPVRRLLGFLEAHVTNIAIDGVSNNACLFGISRVVFPSF